MIRILLSATLAWLALTGQPAAAQSRRFSADDLPKLVRIADPRISPDGKTIAIVVGRANLGEDRYDTELDLVDVASHAIRVMTRERLALSAPHWSPDGREIAFLAQDADKISQIYLIDIAGGDARQLTHSKTSISLLAWHPDGQALAYAAPDQAPERTGEAKFDDAFEVGNNNYTERAASQPTHLWSLTVSDGAAKRLTQGPWSLPHTLPPSAPPSEIAWTLDGRAIVFVRAETPVTGDSDTSRIARLDIASGAVRGLTPSEIQQAEPQISPDGATVAFAYSRDGRRPSEAAIFTTPTAGGPAREATHDIDHGVTLIGWTPDSRDLWVAGNEGTHVAIWRQSLGGGAERLSLGALNPAGPASVGRDGALAFTATMSDHPAELYYRSAAGGATVQLTHLQSATEGAALGRQETVHWTSDGFEVDGVLTYPPDYAAGQKRPLVLYLHGGPTAASQQTFTPPSQMFAAQGWLVFEPNYRGSDGGGNAFETSIVEDAGAGPGRDVMAGVALLEERGLVDTGRIAVTGWSYGGYMTSWLIGHYPHVWRAAVAGAPVTDLVDQYSLSDNNTQRKALYGPSPFVGDRLKAYADQSPISSAWRITTPTLIMSDVGDWRVTTTQAYKLFHALKDNHVPVSFIAYPVGGHSPADPIRSRDVWRRWTAWLVLHLRDTPAA